ncbi:PepSY-like domain-containing protein [Rasiella sp. SM2506]|uniref:PepSY-like domain-containing protein n=1 Tax=Rasiella sp. SM2506 TaxID=3423914 RepID=UPI003D7B5AB5
MKKYFYSVVLVLVVTAVSCQNNNEKKKDKESKAPEAVQVAFQTKYPGENDPDWHLDAHGNYEANFKKKGEKYRADFNPDGTWVETENSIKKKNLPTSIKDKIEKEYSEYEITEVERVDHATKGVFYDVEFKQKGKNKDVMFTEDGTVIQ